MKTSEEVILGERLLTITATEEEMTAAISGGKLHLSWIVLPAPDVDRDRFKNGEWVFNLTRGHWEKP